MDLEPRIASYSAQSSQAIHRFLDRRALDAVARVAQAPVKCTELDHGLCDELIEMHVFREQDGLIRLDTAVFLEEDIHRVNDAASQYAQELARLVIQAAAHMRDEPPAVVNFLIGIVAIGQSLHHALKDELLALDWKGYTGRYAQSKVDFDQVCAARQALGPDLQNKNVLRGEQFTAVFIGPGGPSYLLHANQASSPGDAETLRQLNLFLTDAYAQLVSGQTDHAALRLAAERVGLFRDGKPEAFVLTNVTIEKYLPTIQAVGQITYTYNAGKLGALRELLASTTSGRQDVPPENMMMHLWRYIRRAIASELYASGFFKDTITETGMITVFFENNVQMLSELLG